MMTLLLSDHPIPLRIDDHGTVRVGNTRVSLDSVIYDYQNGATAEQIADDFPTLDLADIHAVISYYLRNRNEVEAYLAAQQKESDEIRGRIEADSNTQIVRERLIARRQRRNRGDAECHD